LLSHPKYVDLEIQKGDFAEALSLTSEAKSRFQHDDLVERGRALITESIDFGVTHMRAFVEVDEGVGMKCLEAGLALKKEFEDRCFIQLCAFAQDPIYSYEDGGKEMRQMMEDSAARDGVDVVGSTPYVEKSMQNQVANIDWMAKLAMKYKLLLDFHLDYNLDANNKPMVHEVIRALKEVRWRRQAVTLGHCTRLTLFTAYEWEDLRQSIGDLPISFIGLPTSDLFMMGRPTDVAGGGDRARGTLQIPQMIQKYGLNGAIGINNVGNAFTPHGSCDPLSIASLGVGTYQAGTKKDAEILFQCVSTRAKAAIGLASSVALELKEGDPADFVIFDTIDDKIRMKSNFRLPKAIQELIYDAGHDRITYKSGKSVRYLDM